MLLALLDNEFLPNYQAIALSPGVGWLLLAAVTCLAMFFIAHRVEPPGAIRSGDLVGQIVAYQPVQGAVEGDAVMTHTAGVEGRTDFVVADRPAGVEQHRQHCGTGAGDTTAAGGDQGGGILRAFGHGGQVGG